jgi:hypothetical protein
MLIESVADAATRPVLRRSYSEKLRDPRWQKKRLQVMEKAGFRCERCGRADRTLDVHHGFYARGLDPWDYPDDTLWCLCSEECHPYIQSLLEGVHRALATIHPKDLANVVRRIGEGSNP